MHRVRGRGRGQGIRVAFAKTRPVKWRLALGAASVAVAALGAVAVGAVAVGALAVGALAIARFGVGKGRFERLEIDELIVRRLTIIEQASPKLSSDG